MISCSTSSNNCLWINDFFCLVSTNKTASYCFVGSNKRWVFQAKSLEMKVGHSNCWRLNQLFANESSTVICFFSTLLTIAKLGMKVSFYQNQVTLEKVLKAFVLIPTLSGQSWTVCRFRGNFLRILIQLFRERLSDKVLATIPKGIVDGF